MVTPAPAPDLGGASPVWMLILLAIIVGPFVWAAIYGIGHRDSTAPDKEDLLDADTMTELARYRANMRGPGTPGFRG
jgi:hypothetical protein